MALELVLLRQLDFNIQYLLPLPVPGQRGFSACLWFCMAGLE